VAVREGLLALLQDGPRHGYQLKSDFEATTGGVWSINVGQVYTTLDRLQRDGLVSIEESDAGKRYTLTRSGKAELGGWWEAVPVDDAPPRDELLLKVLFAIEQGPDHALAVITRQRTALTRLLQEHRRKRSRRSGPESAIAARLVTDAMAVRAEADLRWLDLCEARVMQEDR
jgi:DNA-binding PadR family transcriptional regulator